MAGYLLIIIFARIGKVHFAQIKRKYYENTLHCIQRSYAIVLVFGEKSLCGDDPAQNRPIFVRELSRELSQSTVSQNRTGRRCRCSIVAQNGSVVAPRKWTRVQFKPNCVQEEIVHTRACLVPFSAAFR